jgi:hypothetical protein
MKDILNINIRIKLKLIKAIDLIKNFIFYFITLIKSKKSENFYTLSAPIVSFIPYDTNFFLR